MQAIENLDNFDRALEPLKRFDWESELALKLKQPRVFISQRQADERRARQISRIAAGCGFDFWLDVVDPKLKAVSQLPTTEKQAIAIAAIIAMALINCSHVIALITKNSYGLTWIPHDYRRVKIGTTWSRQACCWIDSSDEAREFASLATYLNLGHRTTHAREIRKWFTSESKNGHRRFHGQI